MRALWDQLMMTPGPSAVGEGGRGGGQELSFSTGGQRIQGRNRDRCCGNAVELKTL